MVLLDVALAGTDFSTLKAIRRVKSVPILMLMARDKVKDRLEGLQQGADDYLVKPFALADLHARVQTLLARRRQQHSSYFRLADLEVDLTGRKCARNRTLLDLTATEFRLLAVLLRRRGQILSRIVLIDEVWGGRLDGEANVVEVAIGRLRNKVDGPFELKLLHTVRGAGYVLEDRSETQP
ncbi:winged helix-turn-helix domain-containing protein [Variovorax sp. RB2P76]|uniref:winged helix-turn-helix domain-containing protein n=1 Tax=Variovorax sp. RB2P76 TaxID=3443736 RepID=UPI003F47CF6C